MLYKDRNKKYITHLFRSAFVVDKTLKVTLTNNRIIDIPILSIGLDQELGETFRFLDIEEKDLL